MNPQIVTVNLIPGLSTPAVVRVSQYDVERPITFRVLDGNKAAVFPDDCTATIEATKPSGLGFSLLGTIAPGGIVNFTTAMSVTQECGMFPAEIRFSTNAYGSFPATDIGTANFILAVEPSPHPDGTTDGTQETMQNLETRLQSEINDLSDRIDDIEAGGSGLSQTEKNLILTLFSKAAYAESDAETAYDQLEALWASSTKTITYNLSNVVSSNTQTSIESGQPYSTALAVGQGYTLNSVSVTMGGVDITSTAYSSGTITIPSVTGNIVITATAVLAAQSITATYTQSGTVYDTDSLDSLKADLVVTANYAGGTSETVPSSNYTLSGTLAVGTSTVTVNYAGLTTTFNVTVTEYQRPYLYNWDFTQSLIDTVASREVTLGAASGTNNATRDSNGLHFNAATQYAYLGEITPAGKTFEFDVASLGFKGSTDYHIRFFSNPNNTTSSAFGLGCLCWKTGEGWKSYGWKNETETGSTFRGWSANFWSSNLTGATSGVINYFNGKTVKVVYHSDGHTKDLYVDNVYEGTIDDIYFNSYGATHLSDKMYLAGMPSAKQASGDQCYDMTITGVRVYENE